MRETNVRPVIKAANEYLATCTELERAQLRVQRGGFYTEDEETWANERLYVAKLEHDRSHVAWVMALHTETLEAIRGSK